MDQPNGIAGTEKTYPEKRLEQFHQRNLRAEQRPVYSESIHISLSLPRISAVRTTCVFEFELVRGAGLEPASLAALEPKSRAFANFANRAENLLYYNTECTTFKPLTEKSPF